LFVDIERCPSVDLRAEPTSRAGQRRRRNHRRRLDKKVSCNDFAVMGRTQADYARHRRAVQGSAGWRAL